MPQPLDPRISEFATQEEADSYDHWYRQKVQEAIDDPRPRIPHDAVMAKIDAMLDRLEQQRKVAA
jgi:hypothetical protein